MSHNLWSILIEAPRVPSALAAWQSAEKQLSRVSAEIQQLRIIINRPQRQNWAVLVSKKCVICAAAV
jgi:hypothetical protein